MEKVALRDALGLPAGDHLHLPYGVLDLALIYSYFSHKTPHAFTKSGLYRATEGSIRRPENYEMILAERPRDRQQAEQEAKTLQDFTLKHGASFIKHEKGSAGNGLYKLEIGNGWVYLTSPRENVATELDRKIDRLFGSEYDNDFIQGGIDRYQNPGCISFAIMKKMADQPLEKIIRTLVLHGFEAGEFVVEAPIQIPSVDGKTWEVRHIIQSPEAKPQVTTSYGKKGSSENFSNILLGGNPVLTRDLMEQVFRQNYTNDQNEVAQLTSQFIADAENAALRVTKALNRTMHSLSATHLSDFDPSLFYARELCVDITGELTPHGRLIPVLGELQFIPLPHMSYIMSLQQIDPQALARITAISSELRDTDQKILTQYINS